MDAIRNWDGLYIRDRMEYNGILSIEMVTDVVSEPLSLQDAKEHLRVDFDAEDAYIYDLIKECREELEGELNVSFAPKTIKVHFRNERGYIQLPYGPVTTIVGVTDYEDEAITGYELNNGVLETAYSTSVFVEYTAGYTNLPAKYRRMLKERVAYKYTHRGDEELNNQNKIWLL